MQVESSLFELVKTEIIFYTTDLHSEVRLYANMMLQVLEANCATQANHKVFWSYDAETWHISRLSLLIKYLFKLDLRSGVVTDRHYLG